MRRFAWALALPWLGGCFLLPGSTRDSEVEDVPEHLRKAPLVVHPVPDRHPYGDVTKLKPGQWALYAEGGRTIRLSVASREGDDVWFEFVDEGEPRQVSARLVAPDGFVKKACYAEFSKDGTRTSVQPQGFTQASATPPVSIEGEVGEERVNVGGRDLTARSVRVRSEDLEGRITEEVTLWHPDVPPVYAGSVHGGLVARRSRRPVTLLDFGLDAKPLLEGVK